MFIQRNKKRVMTKGGERVYQSVLLVESYREGRKVRHRTISNLSSWPAGLVNEFELLLRGGKVTRLEDLRYEQGKSCGALIVINEICKRLGITKIIGNSRKGRLSIMMVMARVLAPSSRLHIVRVWSKDEAIEEVLDIKRFDEDDLYEAMKWLDKRQEEIEDKIFKYRRKGKKSEDIFLYDVTSTYFEGKCNEFAEFGYNRDGKRGKKQMIIGLMADIDGYPITIEVFKGNTQDPQTVLSQLRKLKFRFGVRRVIFVGDRGMIKKTQMEEINEFKWKFITAITKAQIRKLIKEGVIQLELFEDKLGEVEYEGFRYILRRNPERVKEIRKNRESRLEYIIKCIHDKNIYLREHKRASEEVALRNINEEIEKRKLVGIVKAEAKDRELSYSIDKEAMDEAKMLDGCYVIKTDVLDLDKEIIHERYKDLTSVEQAFRTMKTTFEKVRPVFTRKKDTTRAHVFICMLGYIVTKYVWDRLKELEMERDFIFRTLDKIQYIFYKIRGSTVKILPSKLLGHQNLILDRLRIKLPYQL